MNRNWSGLDCSDCPILAVDPPRPDVAAIAWARRVSQIDPDETAPNFTTYNTRDFRDKKRKKATVMSSMYEGLPDRAKKLIREAIENREIKISVLRRRLLDLGLSEDEVGNAQNLRNYVSRRRAVANVEVDANGVAAVERIEEETRRIERIEEETRRIERIEFGDAPFIVVLPDGRMLTTDVETAVRLSRTAKES